MGVCVHSGSVAAGLPSGILLRYEVWCDQAKARSFPSIDLFLESFPFDDSQMPEINF